MSILWGILYVFILLLTGYGLLCLCRGPAKRPAPELLGSVLLLGLGSVGLLLFWFSLMGLRPSRWSLVIVTGLAGGLLWGAYRWKRLINFSFEPVKFRWWQWLLASLLMIYLSYALALVLIHALGHINFEWDGYMLWGFKARAVSVQSLRGNELLHNVHYAPLHLNYPLMLPFLMAGINSLTGELEEILSKLVFPLFYLALGLLVYSGLRVRLGTLQALALLALYLGMPRLLRWAGSAYADVPLAAFYGGNIVYLLKWNNSRSCRDLVLAGVFAAGAAFTKNEGLPMIILAALAIGLMIVVKKERRMVRHLAAYLGMAFLLILPWLIFRQFLPSLDENYPGRLNWQVLCANWQRLRVIVPAFLEYMFMRLEWNGLWHLLLISALLWPAAFKRPEIICLWTLMLSQFVVYGLAYVISPSLPENLIPVSLDRLLIHLSVPAILLLGSHWAIFLEDHSRRRRLGGAPTGPI